MGSESANDFLIILGYSLDIMDLEQGDQMLKVNFHSFFPFHFITAWWSQNMQKQQEL